MDEAIILAEYISGKKDLKNFDDDFKGRYSDGFDPEKHLERLGVVNQTTMLAEETQAIADFLKNAMLKQYGDNGQNNFADTRDTLCYATNDNQTATHSLLKENADLAIVVGGYNSSNTSHLVELLESRFPTFFISSADEIESYSLINHFDYENKLHKQTHAYIPKGETTIILTSGASCPDASVDKVMFKLLAYYENVRKIEDVLDDLEKSVVI